MTWPTSLQNVQKWLDKEKSRSKTCPKHPTKYRCSHEPEVSNGQFSTTRFFPRYFPDSCQIPGTFPCFPDKWRPCVKNRVLVTAVSPNPLPKSAGAIISSHSLHLYSSQHSNDRTVFSFLRRLITWHCPRLLLSAGRAAIERHLVPTEHPAANPQQRRANDGTGGQTRRTPDRHIDPALHTGMQAVSVQK